MELIKTDVTNTNTSNDDNNNTETTPSVNQSILKLTVQEYLENNNGRGGDEPDNNLLRVHILCCTSCKFLTIDLQTLKRHYELEHSKTKEMILGELAIYECKYCRSVSTERQIIKEHIDILHENDQKLDKINQKKETKLMSTKNRSRLLLYNQKLKRYMQKKRCKTQVRRKSIKLETDTFLINQNNNNANLPNDQICNTNRPNAYQSTNTIASINENVPLDFSMKSSVKSESVKSEHMRNILQPNSSPINNNVQESLQNTNITNITNGLTNFSPTNPQMCVEAFKKLLSQINNRQTQTTQPTQPILPPNPVPYINGGLFSLGPQSTPIQMNPQQLIQNLIMATAAFQVSNNSQGPAALNLPPQFMLNNNPPENNNVKVDLETLLVNLQQQQQLNCSNNANIPGNNCNSHVLNPQLSPNTSNINQLNFNPNLPITNSPIQNINNNIINTLVDTNKNLGPNRTSPAGILNQTIHPNNLLNTSNPSRPLKRAYPSHMKQANPKQSRISNENAMNNSINNNIAVTVPTGERSISPRDLSDSSSPPKSHSSTSNQENNATANNIHPNTPQSLLYNRSFLDNSNNPTDYDLINTQDFISNKPGSPNFTKHLINNNTNQMSPLNTSDKPQNTPENGSNKPHRQNFTSQQNRILTDWFYTHTDKPYPSTDDTRIIAERTGLNYAQVKKWFANKRARSTNTKKTMSNNNTPLQRSSSFSLLNTTCQSLSPSSTVNSTNINQMHQSTTPINTNCTHPINFTDHSALPVDFTIKSEESSTLQQKTAN